MPVYNEADGLETYLHGWIETLDSLQIDYEIMALDDGSRDGSGEILERMASNPRITAICKQNEGHGPTILSGTRTLCNVRIGSFRPTVTERSRRPPFLGFGRPVRTTTPC